MFSSNIIVRDQALADLIRSGTSLNWANYYFLMVTVVMIVAWRLSKWI